MPHTHQVVSYQEKGATRLRTDTDTMSEGLEQEVTFPFGILKKIHRRAIIWAEFARVVGWSITEYKSKTIQQEIVVFK